MIIPFLDLISNWQLLSPVKEFWSTSGQLPVTSQNGRDKHFSDLCLRGKPASKHKTLKDLRSLKNTPNMQSKMKYSDILKRGLKETPTQCLLSISIAREFGLSLKPGRKIKADGNCMIGWVMDQLTRYVCI